MANNIEEWDFDSKHVNNNNKPGQFIGGKSTLIAFGPPLWTMTISGNSPGVSSNTASAVEQVPNDSSLLNVNQQKKFDPMPVGLIQNLGMQQGRNIQKIYELGSDRPFLIPGKADPSLNFSKVMYSGPSLLKFVMAYYLERTTNTNESLLGDAIDQKKLQDLGGFVDGYELNLEGEGAPGSEDFFINLASELFTFPFGIMIYMKDNLGVPYGALYAEECYIASHGLGFNTGSNVIVEQSSVQCARFRSLKVRGKDTKNVLVS